MSNNNSTCILAFVPDVWNDIWQSRHHVLSRLSNHYKVLWISPPAYLESWKRGNIRKYLSGRGFKKISNNFWTYAPHFPADYKPQYSKKGLIADLFRFYHRVWIGLYVRTIKNLLDQIGVERVILYIWRPEFHWAIGKFDEILTCYHIDDDYEFNPDKDMPTSFTEMRLLKQSEIVFIHSRSLMAKKGNINPNTYYIPNGVDFNRYRKVMQSDTPLPDDIATIPEPRIGYVGYIKRHIDLPLLLSMAKNYRSSSIVMIGPIRYEHREILEEIQRLKLEPNVFFLGEKPQREIPNYIKALNVCLMPYRFSNYTKYVYPMKLHEYLACGKPVIATTLDNLLEFADVIYCAQGVDNWSKAIGRAMQEDNQALSNQRVAIAGANSWELRIQHILGCLQSEMKKDHEK